MFDEKPTAEHRLSVCEGLLRKSETEVARLREERQELPLLGAGAAGARLSVVPLRAHGRRHSDTAMRPPRHPAAAGVERCDECGTEMAHGFGAEAVYCPLCGWIPGADAAEKEQVT